MDNLGLDDILAAIKKAKTNDNIKGIYLVSGMLNAGLVTAEEIRNALIDFKKSGKFIIAYGELMDQKEYYIASVSDKIIFQSGRHAQFPWTGCHAGILQGHTRKNWGQT